MAERLTWYDHPTYGPNVFAIAVRALPCRGCGEPTTIRFHRMPAHARCWEEAGRPGPDQSTAADKPQRDVDASASPEATAAPAEPIEAGSGDSGAQNEARRQRDRDAKRFGVDPVKELSAWCRAVRDIDPDATDEDCAAALAAWHQHVRVLDRPLRFLSWPGYTGVTLYELLTGAHGSMVQPEPLQSDLVKEITAGRVDAGTNRAWTFVNPDAVPVVGQQVTEIDVTAQFLGAARSTECGDGEPVIKDDVADDWLPRHWDCPGYVRLAARPVLDTLRPAARYSFARLTTGWWLPLPAAKYLARDCGITLQADRALFWPAGRYGRRLAKWCETITTARLALIGAVGAGQPGAQRALAVLKAVYAAFLGGVMKSESTNDKGTLRPDWADMTVSTAGVNALRALDKLPAGIDPIGGLKDAVWFAADTAPFRPAGLVYSDQPDRYPKDEHKAGKWHVNRWGPIGEDLVGAHKRGRAGLLQRAVLAADDTRSGR